MKEGTRVVLPVGGVTWDEGSLLQHVSGGLRGWDRA